MAIQATTEWRIRKPSDGGSPIHGGGFDPGIAGAGTDYTDQAAAELTLSDLATSGAGSTTLTSATGGFTSAMIGNCIRISGGTNATPDYYFVTGHTDTNTVTLDRAPDDGVGGVSSGVGRLGGAFGSFISLAGVGNGGLGSPTITSPLGEGHTVWIRGSGSDVPTSDDYDWDGTGAGYWSSNANGGGTGGKIQVIGYNGRPRINYSGLLWLQTQHWHVAKLFLSRNNVATFDTYGVFSNGSFTGNNTVRNLYFDLNGRDAVALYSAGGSDIYVVDTTGGAAGSQIAIQGDNYGAYYHGCVVEDVRGDGFGSVGNQMATFDSCIAVGCGRHGFYTASEATGWRVKFINCTAYGCGSNGFHANTFGAAAQAFIRNCLAISNGGYGYAVNSGSSGLNDRLIRGTWDYNANYFNTSGARLAHSAGDNDVALSGDPFVDAAGGDFSLNNTAGAGADCREAGWPGVFRGISTTGYRDIGAVETQDAGGGSGSRAVIIGG